MGTGPVQLGFEEAPGRVAAVIGALRQAGREIVVVGVTGPVGAGKSTFARRLADGPHLVVATDDYLPDYQMVPYLERDDPRHADLPLLAAHLASLRQGEAAEAPIWSFQTHRRESTRRLAPMPTIIVEGIHALHPPVRGYLDVAVYVDAPADVRWRRWERLEVTGERGWGVERAREHFQEVAEPWFARNAAAYRAGADFVVDNA